MNKIKPQLDKLTTVHGLSVTKYKFIFKHTKLYNSSFPLSLSFYFILYNLLLTHACTHSLLVCFFNSKFDLKKLILITSYNMYSIEWFLAQ